MGIKSILWILAILRGVYGVIGPLIVLLAVLWELTGVPSFNNVML